MLRGHLHWLLPLVNCSLPPPHPPVPFPPVPVHPSREPVRCSGSSGSSGSAELDDEPPCAEEVEYSTDSGSDLDASFPELDRQIQDCALIAEEGEQGEEDLKCRRKGIP